MAQIYLTSGETYGIVGAGSNSVEGTNANETVTVAANGDVVFDGSFNRGGDVININGNAGDYVMSRQGNYLILTSTIGASNGARIEVPIGEGNGAAIKFADTSTARVLTSIGGIKLGSQAVPAAGGAAVAVVPGDVTPPNGGDDILLTANQDIKTGTGGSDVFLADMVQVNGLQVNTLGTGDNLNGGGGNDLLSAQITRAATFSGNTGAGGINGGSNIPIQPRLNSVEVVKLEALNADLAPGILPYNLTPGYDSISSAISSNPLYDYSNNTEVFFNAKNVRGHNEIWSWYSDANLTVQDLTTIVTNGGHDDARNTSDITIGMGYTSGQDTFWDSSDYHVFFDQDFLLVGQANESRANFFLLDEDGELAGLPRLQNIDVDGIRFTVNGGPPITLSDPDAQFGLTHTGFVAALQDALQDLKDAGLVPQDTELFVDPTRTDFTFLDNGAQSQPIPAIVLRTQTDAIITPIGFSRVEDSIGQYDVYGRFDTLVTVEDLPLTVNIALEKVGRGGEGGDLIVGSMDKYHHGIDVFNVTVYGDDSRPSYLDYLNSTGDGESGIGKNGDLDTILIQSDNTGYPNDTYASLTIAATNDFLTLIDADDFLGDLTLGNECDVRDLKTLRATGGGDVDFSGEITSNLPGAFTYTTGSGNDTIDLDIEGSALEYATSSLLIETGSGNDNVDYFANSSGSQRTTVTFTLAALTGSGAPGGGLPIAGDDVVTVVVDNFYGNGADYTFALAGNGTTPGAFDASSATTEAQLAQLIASILQTESNNSISPWNAASDGSSIVLTHDNTTTFATPSAQIYFDDGDDAGFGPLATASFLTTNGATGVVGSSNDHEFENHIILKNVDIRTGDGADVVTTRGDGQFRVDTGAGNDVIYSDMLSSSKAAWVFNVDRGAYDTNDSLTGLPGIPLRYSLIDGATVRVTFSGAGQVLGAASFVADSGNGGGVMETSPANSPIPGDAQAFLNGIESSVVIDVPNGKYYGTQVDINNAILKAINEHPVLSKLLTAKVGANNTLYVQSKIDGAFVTQDLDVTVTRNSAYLPTSTTRLPDALIQEGYSLGLYESNQVTIGDDPADLTFTNAPGAPFNEEYDLLVGGAVDGTLGGTTTPNGFYSGLDNSRTGAIGQGNNNLHHTGSWSSNEADHTHTPGTGDDVVVLSTNDSAGLTSNGYWTLDGWLFDDSSNETITFRTQDFGKDTIINFQTAGVGEYIFEQENDVDPNSPIGGFDFLNFTEYLTSEESDSGSVASRDRIAVTLNDASNGANNLGGIFSATPPNQVALGATPVTLNANQVTIVTFDDTGTGSNAGETFAGLDGAKLAEVINQTNAGATNGGAYGSLQNDALAVNGAYGANALTNTAKAIVLVQNADNLGQYKVFDVSWNGMASSSTHTATAALIGEIDFGTSLVGLDELNLVGSQEWGTFNIDVSSMIP